MGKFKEMFGSLKNSVFFFVVKVFKINSEIGFRVGGHFRRSELGRCRDFSRRCCRDFGSRAGNDFMLMLAALFFKGF